MSQTKSFLTPTVFRAITTLMILLYFVAATFGFFYFEKDPILRAGFVIIFVASVSEFFVIKRALGFLLFTFYITLFSAFNLIYSGYLAIWIIFLATIPLSGSIIAQWKKDIRTSWKRQDTLLLILISITLLESLILLNFFDLAPHIQAFLTVLIPLIGVDVISDYREKQLTFPRILRISVAVIAAVVIVLLSAPRGIM